LAGLKKTPRPTGRFFLRFHKILGMTVAIPKSPWIGDQFDCRGLDVFLSLVYDPLKR
jgi:hypothetical protein